VSDDDSNEVGTPENSAIDKLLETAHDLQDDQDEKKRNDLGATFKFGQASRTIFA